MEFSLPAINSQKPAVVVKYSGYCHDHIAVNAIPKKFHTQLKKIHFHQKDYWIPEEEGEFLTYRYGNWRVPVKEWDAFKNDGVLVKN